MKEAEKPLDTNTRITMDISSNFPEFSVHSSKKLGEGWMSEAFLVNNEWVFRFPKDTDGAEDLEKEIAIMPAIAKRITLAVPQFTYTGKQRNGLPFVGYKLLPGEILGEETIATLPEATQETIAQQLAQFIDELSAFPVEEAKRLGVPESDHKKDYSDTYEEVKRKMFPLIDEEMQRYVSARFEAYLGNPENFEYTPTLTHADLSPNHYLVDPTTHALTGIIDFGDLIIGDPDYEYVYMLMDCGEDFTRRVMELRGLSEIERSLEKISVFVTVDHIGSLLEGIERGEQDWIDEAIASIRKEMARLK